MASTIISENAGPSLLLPSSSASSVPSSFASPVPSTRSLPLRSATDCSAQSFTSDVPPSRTHHRIQRLHLHCQKGWPSRGLESPHADAATTRSSATQMPYRVCRLQTIFQRKGGISENYHMVARCSPIRRLDMPRAQPTRDALGRTKGTRLISFRAQSKSKSFRPRKRGFRLPPCGCSLELKSQSPREPP